MVLLLNGFTDHTIDTGEVEIAYSTGPDNGPTLLLLHGLTDRRDAFPTVIDTLDEMHRVVAIDQRGHGYSGRTPGHYSNDDHARDIRYILENVCQSPTVVWGHSMGGANAIAMAADPPEQLKALILEDPAIFGRARSTRAGGAPVNSPFGASLELIEAGISAEEMASRIAESEPGMPDYYAPWKAERLAQIDPEILRDVVAGRRRGVQDPKESLAKIDCPVLLMQADPDKGGILQDEFLAEITPKTGDWTVVKVVGAGHVINRNHPELALPIVMPWLAAHS
ncbi:MAG TPA: alpha/beta hydrolase [Dehalococcoidia bacterium]|nr:alpha/beta hydrolase [Dehalococcoidia bacterium]HIN16079.1 alpha/beta hydrolase [Dehalococcoidia bacterium]